MCSQLKLAGTLCRESSNSCDLPEFCTGANPHCPPNVYLHDGHACHDVDGYCYNGICQTHEQQCITLWGPGKTLAIHLLCGVHFFCLWQQFLLSHVCLCVQEQNQLQGYALNESTLQETHTGIVEKTPKAPLQNAMRGMIQQLHWCDRGMEK